ncbi:MAG: hypothetical protein CVU56_04530 [Deltaproteobacteria bacterium HGW-Deltaproteobacteria-14]|nr:MAG: hypothetical protein CVU56_04530 [Deltaproteobacteria bacterium HGW-Deltaproteobacteria-14]
MYRSKALGRRLAGGSWLARVALLAVLALVLGALWLGVDALAAADLASPDPASRESAVRERTFWLTTLAALIFAYSTFEVFFRASDTRLIGSLPIRGRTRYLDLMSRAALLHAPLFVPLAAYGAALAARGAGAAGVYAVLVAAVVFVVGIPLCVWLHLLAGRSLLSDASALKRQLAGGVVADEAALLVYAPAVGLLGTLVLGIVADFALRDALLRGRAGILAPVLAGGAGVAAFAIAKAMSLCDQSLHLIMPRFAEFDVPPPFRDDGVRRKVPGERLGRLLPVTARPYFLRDLRQLRRRYRLDRILLWVYGAALLRLDLGGHAPASLAAHLVALGLIVGVFLSSAFRLRGRELASPWLDQALPTDPRAAPLGRLAADAILPTWALVVTAAAPLFTGDLALAAASLGLGLPLVAALLAASHAVAARAFPDRVLAAAALWRGLLLAATGAVLWQLP